MQRPEDLARGEIDDALELAGWELQNPDNVNIHASTGVAIRSFQMKTGYGEADYLLYVDGKAIGVVEAKKKGTTLTGVEVQTEKYSRGLPDELPAWTRPLPYLYQSTGVEYRFTNILDPEPRSRKTFRFHRPETLREWIGNEFSKIDGKHPTLRANLKELPPLITEGMWQNKIKAITNLEKSFSEDRPRALVQMATGSGKTLMAISSIYRLIPDGHLKVYHSWPGQSVPPGRVIM